MSKWGFPLAFLIVAIPCFSAMAVEGLLRPVNLRCEYRQNPLGIDTLQPRVSWTLEPTDPKVRGQRQTAYQILAAGSEERLRSDQGDLWDTGTVKSDKSIHVPYEGKPRGSGMQVWWKVRVWDDHGNPSAWSEPAFWSMGLLKAEDWKGKWLGLDGGEGKPEQLKEAHWVGSPQPGPGLPRWEEGRWGNRPSQWTSSAGTPEPESGLAGDCLRTSCCFSRKADGLPASRTIVLKG